MRSADLVGRTLAHYDIAAVIGSGGMGEVFRGTDTRLGRSVALKVLPGEFAANPERLARFQREARAIAALNHPHIVTIYSVEECEGVHFLTMELIEGGSLAQWIPENGLPVEQVLSAGTAIAEALAAAHDKGIVHRDLKPANVMMTADGRIKVLDFGLAKELHATAPEGDAQTIAARTAVGIVMGTPAYMSPEQVAGRPIDHRTDIFSLGILLYEMMTGQRPFAGETSIELASAILRDMPRPLGDIRTDAPPELGRLIRRCLEKDPQRRVQTARDVANEFREIARSAPEHVTARSAQAASSAASSVAAARAGEGFWVAVLPFRCTSPNPDVTALAEGLSEEIVTGLSRFSYLRVIARASTLRFAGAPADVRTVANELGARYVMEGSVRQAGSRLRVAVQLVDAATGAHLWADTYERAFTADSLFDLQDDLVPVIVCTVADMAGVLPRSMSDALRGRRADQLTPFEAALRACGYYDRIGPHEHAEVRAILEQAVKTAPGSSFAGRCWHRCMSTSTDTISTRDRIRSAVPKMRPAVPLKRTRLTTSRTRCWQRFSSSGKTAQHSRAPRPG